MLYHKTLPNMCGEFVRWLNDEEFIALINDKELIGHKDFWTGDFKEYQKPIEVSFENNRQCAVVVTFSFDSSISVLLFNTWDDAMTFIKKDAMEEYYIDIYENVLDSDVDIFEEEGRAVLTTHYESGDEYTEWRIATIYKPNDR